MLTLTAIKTDKLVIKGKKYKLGGIIQNTNNCVIMNHLGNIVIPGYYDLTEVFNESKELIIKKMIGG